ncbi:EscE/YscE/SsaE family type III secretion system needle protein co-chaperone [Bremerella sp. JC770]|uniref:EscE/YscE/SsaE family type III secretion system needle protein co-chaperone n=1 Tax=Bremerella sp. JC770 TaxID=3232137 RepID=UPI0034581841
MNAPQSTSSFVTTPLERSLKSDQSGSCCMRIAEELETAMKELQTQARKGLASNDFRACQKLIHSLRVARNVLREQWKVLHQSIH